MATQYALNGSVDALGALLGEGGAGVGYFSNISYEDHAGGIKEIVCQSDSLYFRLGGMTGYSANAWCVGCTSGNVSHVRYNGNSGDDTTDYNPLHAYVCEKGISIETARARILITKTNNGKTAVAFGDSTPGTSSSSEGIAKKTAAVMNTICAIADGDGDDYKFFINNCYNNIYDRLFNQTLIIPIPTQAGFGAVSYTDHAGLILLPQTRDICNFSYNNKRYFSDGYFAIEDTAS